MPSCSPLQRSARSVERWKKSPGFSRGENVNDLAGLAGLALVSWDPLDKYHWLMTDFLESSRIKTVEGCRSACSLGTFLAGILQDTQFQ